MATDSDSKSILTCRITDLEESPLSGLPVRAYNQDPNTPPNPLGTDAKTGEDGSYRINFGEEEFRLGGVESGEPDIVFQL